MFIAGVLTLQHYFPVQIPCSNRGGCEAVKMHSSSMLNGYPVALFGFIAYVVLTGLAIVRGFTQTYSSKLLTGSGYVISAIGLIASLYLQYISLTQIHAICEWCMSSALTMVVTFVFYTMLLGRLGSELNAEKAPRSLPNLLQGIAIAVIALSGALAVIFTSPNSKVELMDDKVAMSLVPEPRSERNQLGPDDAPVTLVEYADLCCPQCRKSMVKVKEIVAKYPGKIRVIYRYFPLYNLPGHQMSLRAVMAAELAGKKNKFWEFVEAFSATDEAAKTPEELDPIAAQFGVTTAEIDKAMEDENSPAQKRLERDYKDGLNVFSIDSTPTYMLQGTGLPTKKMLQILAVLNELETPQYQKLLKP
jgi:protein-disulfide isomerase